MKISKEAKLLSAIYEKCPELLPLAYEMQREHIEEVVPLQEYVKWLESWLEGKSRMRGINHKDWSVCWDGKELTHKVKNNAV